MTERLNNDQIIRRITDTNSDLKRYLDLAPSFKLTSSQPETPNEYSRSPVSPAPVSRPLKVPLTDFPLF
jgi:hypothetical protein